MPILQAMKYKAIIAIIIAFVLAASSLTAAQALTNYAPTFKASNGTVTVGASSDGTLAYTTDNANWIQADAGLSKNGIRSLTYVASKNLFIATSFFAESVSTDGKTWTKYFLPVGEKFNPADIISDSEFFGATSMTVDQIQSFINSKIPYCSSGYTCLNSYTETTWSRAATALCSAYTSEGTESAAKIIWKVSQACGIKAEVLLVTLQKESSLVASGSPSISRYRTAMGYACPDSGVCDSEYYGFYNQVYNAAKQFKRYANPAGTSLYFTWYPVGQTSNILWSPNTACGTSPVVIANQATSGLYYYTPYQPNAASLKNIQGEGDACSSYGNRNFWRTYNVWFNTDKDYSTFVANNGSTILAVDDNGSVGVSADGINWNLNDPMSISGNINKFEYDSYNNKFHAVSTSGLHYYSADGTVWTSQSTAMPGKPAPVVSVNTVPNYYTVKAGDTLTSLAKWYKTTVADMVKWNKIPTTTVLTVGQKIIVGYKPNTTATPAPTPTTTPSPTITPTPTLTPTPAPTPTVTAKYYTVVSGDTMWGISNKFNVSLYTLSLLNPTITDLSKIYVGQTIRYQ